MLINNVVFVHGWGLNRAIWQNYIELLTNQWPEISFSCVDIPGYGALADQPSSASLDDLAQACLVQAPEQALWVGWSLGGMIALQAALRDAQHGTQRVQALQLLNSTAKFVRSDDWPNGVDIAIFQRFCDELAADYERTLASFLLLQAGKSKESKALARSAQQAISEYPRPTEQTLNQGIECLANTDLRTALPLLKNTLLKDAIQLVFGTLDRVTNPLSSKALGQALSAEIIELKTGHAPFLTQPEMMLNAFRGLLQRISSEQEYGAIF